MPEAPLGLHQPNIIYQALERLGVREINPKDLCRGTRMLDKLYALHPGLRGDTTSLGYANGLFEGSDNSRGWWRQIVTEDRALQRRSKFKLIAFTAHPH